MSNRSVPKAENSTRTALDKSISSAPSAKDASKDEDTDIARLKIPQSAIKELQALVNTPREPIKDRGNTGPRDRLFASILTVTTVAALEGVIGCLGASFPAVAGLLAGFLAWFLCTWTLVHGRGLNRRRIALFNERNFLDTYQVFNREFGHLFQPEPNTPGGCCGPAPENVGESPVQTIGKELIEDQEKTGFQDAVQQHYGGMYTNVKRVQAELQLLDRANRANSDAGRGPNDVLEPADIPLPGAPADEGTSK